MRLTLTDLRKMHADRQPIVVLTSYDASMARVAQAAGVDVLLVGDSLGMVIQGHDSPNPVTLADIAYHTAAVKRGADRAFVLADMPFGTSQVSPADTFRNAATLIQAGAQMVKLEGGSEMAETVAFLTQRGIPVCGHIGMTPQSHHQFGGFRVQGRLPEAAARLQAAARDLVKAGAALLLMECIPETLARSIAETAGVPTIGIGASAACSGQVLVVHDVIGLTADPLPRLAKRYDHVPGGVQQMIAAYVADVRARTFPDASHCY